MSMPVSAPAALGLQSRQLTSPSCCPLVGHFLPSGTSGTLCPASSPGGASGRTRGWPHLWDTPRQAAVPDPLKGGSETFLAAAVPGPAGGKPGAGGWERGTEEQVGPAARNTPTAFVF